MNVDQITEIYNAVRNELGNPEVSLQVVDFAIKFREEIDSFGNTTPVTRQVVRTDVDSKTIFVNGTQLDKKPSVLYADWATMLSLQILNLMDPILKPVFQYSETKESRTSILELGVPSLPTTLTLTLWLGQAQNHFVSIAVNTAWEMACIRRLPTKFRNLQFDVISPKMDFDQSRRFALTPRALELGIAAESPRYLGYSMIASEKHSTRIKDELHYVGLGFRLTELFTSVMEMLRPFANESTDVCKGLIQRSAETSTSLFRKWLAFRGLIVS
jgi:hypothetical protein